VNLREYVLENIAGDLEYHPRRAVIYLGLAAGALCFWGFSPADQKFGMVPLVFLLGGLALCLKGVFLLRRSSEGLGLSQPELAGLSDPSNRKPLPFIPQQVAQIIQDFGTGGLLLWPILNIGKDIDSSWAYPPRLGVALIGMMLFSLGWSIRRLTTLSRS
jgi:hypothetical protein